MKKIKSVIYKLMRMIQIRFFEKEYAKGIFDELLSSNRKVCRFFKDQADFHKFLKNNPNFFGRCVYRLIAPCELISPYMLNTFVDYTKDEILSKGIPMNMADYHTHMAFFYLTMGDFSKAINEIELVNSANLLQELCKWKSFKSMITKMTLSFYPCCALKNPSITVPIKSSRLFRNYAKETVITLLRWKKALIYSKNIPYTDTAYTECLSSLEFTCIFFERCLYDYLTTKYPRVTLGANTAIGPLIRNYSNVAPNLCNAHNQIRGAANLSSALPNYKSIITAFSTVDGYLGGIFGLCRVIRNGCSHKMNLQNKLFTTEAEFKEYMGILREGILLTTV